MIMGLRKFNTQLLAACFALALALPSFGQVTEVLVDDDFADNDLTQTGALDTDWWTSSSSSGIEIAPGVLGLVTGTSGRGIHTVFPRRSLNTVGDMIIAEYTFTTPATVGASGGTSAAFRVGLYDTLDRAGLDANVSASSSNPNELYGWGTLVTDGAGVPGPGTLGIPGYMMDHDVHPETAPDPTSDLNFRRHNQNGLTETGRLMATTSNFSSVGSSGPDAGYVFSPNTEYSGSFMITRASATELELTGTLSSGGAELASYSLLEENFISTDFSFFGFHANSNKFGSTNQQGEPDNGLDFSRVTISYKTIPEPGSVMLLLAGLGSLGLIRRR